MPFFVLAAMVGLLAWMVRSTWYRKVFVRFWRGRKTSEDVDRLGVVFTVAAIGLVVLGVVSTLIRGFR